MRSSTARSSGVRGLGSAETYSACAGGVGSGTTSSTGAGLRVVQVYSEGQPSGVTSPLALSLLSAAFAVKVEPI